MAIVFEPKQRKVNWMRWITILFILLFLGLATYYLFFAPTPKFEVILPKALKDVEAIANQQYVDPGAVFSRDAYKALKPYTSSPSVGLNGRSNPFLPFQ